MRISHKLVLAVVLVVSGALLVHALLRVRREAALFRSDTEHDHRVLAEDLAAAAIQVAQHSGPAPAIEFLREANEQKSDVHIGWQTLPLTDPEVSGLRAEPGHRRGPVHSEVVGTGRGHALETRLPLMLSDGHSGVLEVRESLVPADQYVHRTIVRTVSTWLATVVVCGLLVLVLGWYLVGRPMKLLVGKLRRVGEGDLTGRLAFRSRDEMGELAREVDAMCDRLDEAHRRTAEETAARISALEQLRHADRLTTVGKLASGIAHEVGTPLNVILGRARMIERGESRDDEAADDARVIAEQSSRIAGIVRRLLDFARQPVPKKGEDDLTGVIDKSVALLRPLARKAEVDLTVDCPDERLAAPFDADQMEQVLTNLIINAVQAQRSGGKVRIRATKEDGWARIDVEDEGPGMSEHVRSRVFEPFFTTKEVGEGTGLGLSVAYGIVREHAGRIEVWSEPGRGSRFTIWLPGLS